MPVTTIGITAEGTALSGHVKLAAGPGITLTRVDADNAIRIDGAAPQPELNANNDGYAAFFNYPPQLAFSFTTA